MSVHRCHLKSSVDRRDFLAFLAAGLVSAVSCSVRGPRLAPKADAAPLAPDPRAIQPKPPLPPMSPIPPPNPGPFHLVSHGPDGTMRIALTIDDGTCAECVAGYVSFAELSGIHITFAPNGVFKDLWEPHTDRLRALIQAGQVQIGNHTWAHSNLMTRSDAAIRTEIEKNEDWIERTYGITARPWFRPPFGKHNAHIDGIAGSLGFTNILLWNATLGDASKETAASLMDQAQKWILPGAIVLGHANHPTVLSKFDELQQLISQRDLEPVTLDTMFGTSRAVG